MTNGHISGADILLWIDGELPPARAAAVGRHLAACAECHDRWRRMETTLDGYLGAHERTWAARPAPRLQARSAFAARLHAHAAQPASWPRWRAYAGLCACLALAVSGYWLWQRDAARPTPIASLTPGLALTVSPSEVCGESRRQPQFITASMAQAVFAEYGIRNPAPRAYEVDYLVTPALGGAEDIRNLWPQPYDRGAWNSRVKDALEDRLHAMVCRGDLDLAVAQRELATDWVAAYRKYFATDQPLAEHRDFHKDEPWE